MIGLAMASRGRLAYYGNDACIELAGRKIFMVHFPHCGHALASTGDWDLACCDHDHRASVSEVTRVRGGTNWLVDPGTIAGIGAPPAYLCAERPGTHGIFSEDSRRGTRVTGDGMNADLQGLSTYQNFQGVQRVSFVDSQMRLG